MDDLGIEPIVHVAFPWGTYTSKTTIRSMGSVANQSTNISSVMALNVTLDDTSGIFKTQFDSYQLQGAECSVYLTFVGESSNIQILEGVVSGDITWDEGNRSFSCSIESKPSSGLVGYVPKVIAKTEAVTGMGWKWGWTVEGWPYVVGSGEIPGKLNKESCTKPWPICFGTVLKVPAAKMTDIDTGTLADDITEVSDSFDVVGGENFHQDESFMIMVGDICYKGSFTSQTFTATEKNRTLAYNTTYYDLDFAARKTGDINEKDGSVAWLKSPCDYRGKFLYIREIATGGKHFVCKVKTQEGKKLYFGNYAPFLIDDNYTVEAFAGSIDPTWEDQFGGTYQEYFSSQDPSLTEKPWTWSLSKGAKVIDMETKVQYYVADTNPGATIHAVYAYRTYDNKRTLQQVPSSYYIIDDASGITTGFTVTAIILPKPLSSYIDEGWEDQIYVTLTSTGDSNAVDLIDWLLTTYTDLTPDAVSFASVRTKIANYPVGFALLEQKDALELAQEIAWQSRCALIRRGTKVYIKYLSEAQTLVDTFDEDEVLMDSLKLGFNTIEDVVTTSIAKWQEDYSENGSRQYTYNNNNSLYGSITKEYNYYIYNQQSLVKLSTDFWGNRYSNIWRKVEIELPLKDYLFNIEDRLDTALTDFVGSKCFLKNLSHNLNENTVTLTLESACKMATSSDSASYWLGDPTNPVGGQTLPPNKATGVAEKDFSILTDAIPYIRPDAIKFINTTGITLEPGMVAIRGKKDDRSGYDDTIVTTALPTTKDAGVPITKIIRVVTEALPGTVITGVVMNYAEGIYMYEPATGEVPKIGEFWSPPVGGGKLTKGGRTLIVTGDLGAKGSDYYLTAIPPNMTKAQNIEFRQEDGIMPANMFDYTWIADHGVVITGCYHTVNAGIDYTFQLQTFLSGLKGPVITYADVNNLVTFSPAVILEAGEKFTIQVTSATDVVGFVAQFLAFDLSENYIP